MSRLDGHLELALERFARVIAHAGSRQAQTATALALHQAAADLEAVIDTHAEKRQFVHGVGPLFVAKTRNPNQYPDWTEIQNKPAVFPGTPFDPADLELDGEQIATGTVGISRLPVAAPGAISATMLVRADDPRLMTRHWVIEAGEPLYNGHLVTVNASQQAVRASATSWQTAAIGFVADDYGQGQLATIYSAGISDHVYVPGVQMSNRLFPLYLSTTPGYATLTIPPSGIVQIVGVLLGVISATLGLSALAVQPYEELE